MRPAGAWPNRIAVPRNRIGPGRTVARLRVGDLEIDALDPWIRQGTREVRLPRASTSSCTRWPFSAGSRSSIASLHRPSVAVPSSDANVTRWTSHVCQTLRRLSSREKAAANALTDTGS
jgi:hypothetical protein